MLFVCDWHENDVSLQKPWYRRFLTNRVDDAMTGSSEDADDVQWYDSLQLWYLFRQTLWQQDVSLSKALAQPIPICLL